VCCTRAARAPHAPAPARPPRRLCASRVCSPAASLPLPCDDALVPAAACCCRHCRRAWAACSPLPRPPPCCHHRFRARARSKIKLAAKTGKKGKEEEFPKRQKTGRGTSKRKGGAAEKEEEQSGDGKPKDQRMEDKSEDSVDEEIRRLTANLATKRKPVASVDESQRTISALLEQTRKTQRGLMYAASADVSACDETQAEDEVGRRGGKAVGASQPPDVDGDADMPPAQAQTEKCIIGIKRNGDAKTKKFKIFMNDQMHKVMDAYILSKQLDSSKVRFIFDGLPISRLDAPPPPLLGLVEAVPCSPCASKS